MVSLWQPGPRLVGASGAPSSLHVSLYVRSTNGSSGPTPVGAAFWDNVTLWGEIMRCVLLTPVYRGRVTDDDTEPISKSSKLQKKCVEMYKLMKGKIKKLNGTLPELIKKQPDDDDWAW